MFNIIYLLAVAVNITCFIILIRMNKALRLENQNLRDTLNKVSHCVVTHLNEVEILEKQKEIAELAKVED